MPAGRKPRWPAHSVSPCWAPATTRGEAAADEAWLGDGRKAATADDVRRTVWVFAAACALVAVLTAAIAAGTALSGS